MNLAATRRSDERFGELQAGLKKWGRFDLTDNPELADVTITLATGSSGVVGGVAVGNTFLAASDSLLTVTIKQNVTGTVLWSSTVQGVSRRSITNLLARIQEQIAPILEIQGRERWTTTLPIPVAYLTKISSSSIKLEFEGEPDQYEPVVNLSWEEGRWLGTTKGKQCPVEAYWELRALSPTSFAALLRCRNRQMLTTTLTKP
jgi:hypothetical protein